MRGSHVKDGTGLVLLGFKGESLKHFGGAWFVSQRAEHL